MTSTQRSRPGSRRNWDRTWTFTVTAAEGDTAVEVGQLLSDGCGHHAGFAAWVRLTERVAERVLPGRREMLAVRVADEGATMTVADRSGARVVLHLEEVNVL